MRTAFVLEALSRGRLGLAVPVLAGAGLALGLGWSAGASLLAGSLCGLGLYLGHKRGPTREDASGAADPNDLAIQLDLQGRVCHQNAASRALIGEQLRAEDLPELLHPDERDPLEFLVRGYLSNPNHPISIVHRLRRGGDYAWFDSRITPINDAGGKLVRVRVSSRDVTEFKLAEAELRESELRFRQLAAASFEGIAVIENGLISDANDALHRLLGHCPGALVGRSPTELTVAADQARISAALESGQSENEEFTLLRADGSEVSVELRGRTIRGRERVSQLVAIRDITQRKLNEQRLFARAEELNTLATRDELTGLLNRRGFMLRAEAQLEIARAKQAPLTIFFIDLNGMKQINDKYGHEAGDEALKECARVLEASCRAQDLVARLGGDEFVICALNLGPDNLRLLRDRLQNTLDTSNLQRRAPYALSFSLGDASFNPLEPISLETLLAQADSSMYEHKRRNRIGAGLYAASA